MNKETAELINIIEKDETIPPESRLRLLHSLHLLPAPFQTDRLVYRMVVFFLGITVILTVGGGIFIVFYWGNAEGGRSLPEGILALGSAAVGALAGLLAPSPISKS